MSDNELNNLKLPPQVIDLEESVLGALMLEKDAIIEVTSILTEESFYKKKHSYIYQAIVTLYNNLDPIDILTVSQELKKKKKLEQIGGVIFLTSLTEKVSSSAHIVFYSRIIAQKLIQRKLINISSEIIKKSYNEDTDVDELLNYSEQELFKISEGTIKKEVVKINSIIESAIEQIKEAGQKANGLSGISSGFTVLDRITSGWQNTDLIILAARPSIGKTGLALSMSRNMAVDHEIPVAFFSLEMSSLQLVTRLIISETGISNNKIKNGNLAQHEWTQLNIQIKKLYEAPIFIDDTPAISTSEFRSKCRMLKMQHNINLVIVDYLQLMTTGFKNGSGMREQEVSLISRTLKAIAKEINIPIIALSQLNRSLETRSADKKPQLQDLRESGAIEQDADIVMFINRPERYGLTEITLKETSRNISGMANVIIAKHRNGAVGEVWLKFISNGAKFSDLDHENNKIFNSEYEKNNDPETANIISSVNSDFNNSKEENISDLPVSNEFDEKAPF